MYVSRSWADLAPIFGSRPLVGSFEVPVGSNSNVWFFPGPCAAVTFPILVQNDLFRLIFTIFDLSRPLEGRLAHYLRVRARYGCRGVCGGSDWLGGGPVQPERYKQIAKIGHSGLFSDWGVSFLPQKQ